MRTVGGGGRDIASSDTGEKDGSGQEHPDTLTSINNPGVDMERPESRYGSSRVNIPMS